MNINLTRDESDYNELRSLEDTILSESILPALSEPRRILLCSMLRLMQTALTDFMLEQQLATNVANSLASYQEKLVERMLSE